MIVCWSCCWPCCTCCCWFAREPPIVAPWTYRSESKRYTERFTVHIDCLLAAIEAEARCVLRGLRCRAYSRYRSRAANQSAGCGRVVARVAELSPRHACFPLPPRYSTHLAHLINRPLLLPAIIIAVTASQPNHTTLNTAHTLLSPLKPTCLVRRERAEEELRT